MNLTRDRLHSIGWAFVLSVCAALTGALTLRVNAVKSQVHQTEVRIVHLRREIVSLETEYQTRSNQQQLKALNDVEFGYAAPRAEQYIEGERNLAVLGKPRGPEAPAPIRLAYADSEAAPQEEAPFLAMVSPVTGLAASASAGSATAASRQTAAETGQGGRLSDAIARGTPAQRISADVGQSAGQRADPVKAAITAATLGDRLARIEPVEADTQ